MESINDASKYIHIQAGVFEKETSAKKTMQSNYAEDPYDEDIIEIMPNQL